MIKSIIIFTVVLPIYEQEFDWFILSDASEISDIGDEIFMSIDKCLIEKGVTDIKEYCFKIKAIIPLQNPLLTDFTDYIA